MSTKNTIWLGSDESGTECHLYWELGERIPGKGCADFYEHRSRRGRNYIRLPKDVGQKSRDFIEPDAAWEVI